MNVVPPLPDPVSVAPAVFGTIPAGRIVKPRRAAYAVIHGLNGRVATVRSDVTGTMRHWLPGGGLEIGETPEVAVLREIREELGHSARLGESLGTAIQRFYAGDEGWWYEMHATFFQAELSGVVAGPAECEVCWLDPVRESALFFHACHAWAVRCAVELRSVISQREVV